MAPRARCAVYHSFYCVSPADNKKSRQQSRSLTTLRPEHLSRQDFHDLSVKPDGQDPSISSLLQRLAIDTLPWNAFLNTPYSIPWPPPVEDTAKDPPLDCRPLLPLDEDRSSPAGRLLAQLAVLIQAPKRKHHAYDASGDSTMGSFRATSGHREFMNKRMVPDMSFRGFFYHHGPAFAPPYARTVRFRVTSSSDPASFVSGTDLVNRRTMMPLEISLREIVQDRHYGFLLAVLLRDGLLTADALRTAFSLWGPPQKRVYRTHLHSCQLLYALNQPFFLPFPVINLSFEILGHVDGVPVTEYVQFEAFSGYKYPYRGGAICAFELLDGPGRVIGIRVLHDPLRISDSYWTSTRTLSYPPPREGELLSGPKGPWTYACNVSARRETKSGLRLLDYVPGGTPEAFRDLIGLRSNGRFKYS